MEIFCAFFAGVLFWLPRIAVISLVLATVIWVTAKSASWFIPQSGDPAPEFQVVGGNAEQNSLLARLLQAEFMRIKGELASGAVMVDRLYQAWTREFEENQKKQSRSAARQAQSASQVLMQNDARVIPSKIIAPVNLSQVSAAAENLKLLAGDLNKANVPDIKIASVELGPILRWLIDMFRPAADNKVVIFDDSSAALIEGPIVSNGRTVLELEPLTDAKKRTAHQIVEPVAYQILASKLASAEPKIDFGSWTALRDFVNGTKSMAMLVSQPKPGQEDHAKWDKEVAEAARLIKNAGVAAGDWRFVALASFLFERSRSFDDAIRLLDQYAEFTGGNKEAEDGREARLAYLRDRRVELAVTNALEDRKGDGTVFTATTTALAKLPSVVAARKLHRLDGVPDRAKVKIAIVSGAKPPWFGLDRPPDLLPIEDVLDRHGAGLAQVVRALTPSADVVFVPVASSESQDSEFGVVSESDILKALDALAGTDVPVILLPLGPLQGAGIEQAIQRLTEMGRLVIVPAGNSGGPTDFPLAAVPLVAESVNLDGRRSSFSSQVKGALGAVGELPTVDLIEAGPTVVVGTGTSYAAATLAAIAAESIARQPTLKGKALREALIKAAHPVDSQNPPVARVVIPR
jgi:hypothetical protein